MHNDEIDEIKARLAGLETKVDALIASFNQATGALLFVKLAGGFMVGLAIVLTFFRDLIHWPR